MHRNIEGYFDPTAGQAMSQVMLDYKWSRWYRYADKNRRKVYVASRYAGDIEGNVDAAIRYCQYAIREGYMPIASHLMYPQILSDTNPQERELGLRFGLALLALCDEVWVFGAPSYGMMKEIDEARRLCKKIRYFREGCV